MVAFAPQWRTSSSRRSGSSSASASGSRTCSYRSSIKTYFRRLQTAVDGGDSDAVAAEHVALVKLIDKAGAKRILHPNTAARKKSNAASIVSRGPQEVKAKRKKAVRK